MEAREALVLNESRDNRFDRATFYAKFLRTIRVSGDEGGNVISNSLIANGQESAPRIGVVEGVSAPRLEWTLVDRKLWAERVGLGEGVILGAPGFKNPPLPHRNLF